jgi:hypothetical protein
MVLYVSSQELVNDEGFYDCTMCAVAGARVDHYGSDAQRPLIGRVQLPACGWHSAAGTAAAGTDGRAPRQP